jgi:hypothetical protein
VTRMCTNVGTPSAEGSVPNRPAANRRGNGDPGAQNLDTIGAGMVISLALLTVLLVGVATITITYAEIRSAAADAGGQGPASAQPTTRPVPGDGAP